MQRATIVFLLILHLVSAENGTNIISSHTYDVCVTHQCAGWRCGLPPSKSGGECGCDALCEYYGDCCYDYSSTCDTYFVTEPAVNSNLLQCVSGDRIFENGYYVIGLCQEATSPYIDKCEQPSSDDILLMIIVSDENDAIYKNVYCALCNGVSIHNVTAWGAEFNCVGDNCNITSLLNGTQKRSLQMSNFVKFTPITNRNDNRRACSAKAIAGCNKDFLIEDVVDSCETNYKAIVYVDEAVYVNPDCAICNGDAIYSCNDPSNGLGPGLDFLVDITPLAIIVDFSTQSTIRVDSKYGSYVAQGETCVTGEVFDPFTSNCLPVTCKTGFTLQDTQCVGPPTQSVCDKNTLNMPLETFCSCKMEEQSINIEYQYKDDVNNFISFDEITNSFDLLELEYTEKFMEHSNLTILAISIKSIHCQLAYDLHKLVFGKVNDTNATQLTLVTFTQNCSTEPLPSELFCVNDHNFTFANKFSDKSSEIYPGSDIGHILKVFHHFMNGSYTCSSSFLSTCQTCPQITLNSSAFEDEGNGTLVHELTGKTFAENDYFYVSPNTSDVGSVVVCSFLNKTKIKFIERQFFIYDDAQKLVSLVGTILSLTGLSITIILRLIFPELRTLSGKIIVNISITLFCAILITLLQGNFTKWKILCQVIAVILQYLWLVCFMWMNTIAFELFRTFRFFRASPRNKSSQNKSFIIYFMYSWGIPAIYVGTIVFLNHCDCTRLNKLNLTYGDASVCWIRGWVASLYVFGIPLAIILLPNLLLFIATITGIREAKQSTAVVSDNKSKNKQLIEEMVIYIRISTVMGLSWILGFLASFIDHEVLWYLFTILNSLQGFFIFIAFNITHSTKKILTSQKKNKQTSLALRTQSSLSTRSTLTNTTVSHVSQEPNSN